MKYTSERLSTFACMGLALWMGCDEGTSPGDGGMDPDAGVEAGTLDGGGTLDAAPPEDTLEGVANAFESARQGIFDLYCGCWMENGFDDEADCQQWYTEEPNPEQQRCVEMAYALDEPAMVAYGRCQVDGLREHEACLATALQCDAYQASMGECEAVPVLLGECLTDPGVPQVVQQALAACPQD